MYKMRNVSAGTLNTLVLVTCGCVSRSVERASIIM